MELEYEPLLRVARELYDMPRGMERFREYLELLVDERTKDLKLPLVGLNPMGREHVSRCLDELLALDADGIAKQAIVELRADVRSSAGSYRVALCLADDLKGGWTDRAATEFSSTFESDALTKRGWIVATLWTSERYDAERVRAEVRAAVLRVGEDFERGKPRTLRERLAREARVAERAGPVESAFDAEELAYTAHALSAHLEATDWPTAIAALFGDEAARKLGLAPLGVSPRASLAWAREALRSGKALLVE